MTTAVAERDIHSSSSPAAAHVRAVRGYVKSHLDTEAVVISAQIESELVDLSDEEAAEYLAGLGVTSEGSGVATLLWSRSPEGRV